MNLKFFMVNNAYDDDITIKACALQHIDCGLKLERNVFHNDVMQTQMVWSKKHTLM